MSNLSPMRPTGGEYARTDTPAFPMQGHETLSIATLLNILRRRLWLIVGIVVLATSLVTIYVKQLVPLYSAEATLVVEPSRTRALNDSVVRGLSPDYYTNETEAAVVGSRELARQAVIRLGLADNPLFNPELVVAQPSLFGSVAGGVSGWLKARFADLRDIVSGGSYSEEQARLAREAAARRAAAALSPEAARQEAIEVATDIYMNSLVVQPSQRSRVLTVRFTSVNPAMAAKAANATADIYILDQLETKGRATTRASDWLNQRANELRTRVIESEKRLEEFRRDSGIVEIGGASVYARQRAELDSQLIAARTKRAETDARYDQVQRLLRSGGDVDTAAAVLDSPLIQRLREQEAQVVRKIAELKTQLRDEHPKMVLAQNELSDLQDKIRSEVEKIVSSLRNERDIAAVRETNLNKEITSLQGKLDEQHGAEVTLRALDSEVKANKQLYETILSRFKEADVQEQGIQEADARVISHAIEPSAPFYPKTRFMLISAFVLSAMLGIGLAILLEFLDNGFRSLNQLEGMTGLPTLGLVPMLRGSQRGKKAFQVVAEQPNSPFGEAVRTLRTSLLLSNVDHPPRTVVVTSAVPGEGKTSTSLAIATLAAKSGQRCIIVDCDFRHPSVHANLGYPNRQGLGDYLAGNAQLSDVIELEPRYGLRFITAGASVPNPPDVLGSPRMKDLIQRLSESYDLVILDTPPLLIISDSLVLVRNVDKTVYVVRWEKTKRQSAMLGLKQILEAGGDLAGTILTQVDVRKHAQYDYSDSGYYSYHHYYTQT
ncbi:MAG TPA: polysaccharide biosynthesis tyrosine autokinase [Alphaproteobacteria bacterium]|nr:polysaccharide biosynthesis tyrosine autokinase [Alphaproteobacteria bacterium]